MIQDDEIPFRIEPVPQIKGFRCKALVYLVYGLIVLLPFVVSLIVWYNYNIWVAIAFFLFLTLISGIVVSKLRVNSIPYEQREMTYSTYNVVKWFVGKNLCFN